MTTKTKVAVRRIPQSYRLSPEALKIVARQSKRLGVTKTAVLEMALRDMDRSGILSSNK